MGPATGRCNEHSIELDDEEREMREMKERGRRGV